MKKKRLLVFASTFPRWKNDTLPPFVYELSKRLTSEFDVHILAPHYPGSKRFEIMDNMKVYRFRYFIEKYQKLAGSGGILPTLKKNKLFYFQVPFFMLAETFSLYRLTKKIKPDVIHAHWIIPQGFAAAINKKLTGAPYVVTTHGGDIFGLQGRFPTLLKKFILRNAKEITVVSTAIKKEISKKVDSNLCVKVIPMGVDSKLFNPNKMDANLKKKYEINGPFLLFVGRLTEKKGVEYLIKAMPDIVKENKKTKLLIVGSGELENKLKSLSKSLNLEKHVIFIGPIPNSELPKYYATADIFIGPSIVSKGGDTEGFGLTFVEAGMSGCYLIGTNVGGIKDIITNEFSGALINSKKESEISKSVIDIIDLKNARKRTPFNKFSWASIKEQYHTILWN